MTMCRVWMNVRLSIVIMWENRLEMALIICFPLIGCALLGYGLLQFFH